MKRLLLCSLFLALLATGAYAMESKQITSPDLTAEEEKALLNVAHNYMQQVRKLSPEEYVLRGTFLNFELGYGTSGRLREDDELLKNWPPTKFGHLPSEFTLTIDPKTMRVVEDHRVGIGNVLPRP